jgi:hypothetical protein
MKEAYPYRIMAKFSSVPVYKSMIKQPRWKLVKVVRTMGKVKVGGNMGRGKKKEAGFREGGIRCWSFEYV